MSHSEKAINSFDIFYFHCHTISKHCASIIAAFFFHRMAEIWYILSPVCVVRQMQVQEHPTLWLLSQGRLCISRYVHPLRLHHHQRHCCMPPLAYRYIPPVVRTGTSTYRHTPGPGVQDSRFPDAEVKNGTQDSLSVRGPCSPWLAPGAAVTVAAAWVLSY
jgi:hypothetical protein